MKSIDVEKYRKTTNIPIIQVHTRPEIFEKIEKLAVKSKISRTKIVLAILDSYFEEHPDMEE